MALPDNVASTQRLPSVISGAGALPVTATVDYEDGGVALNDSSGGLLFQRWRGRLIGDDFILDAPNTPPLVAFSGTGITEISFTFDQNMRLALAFVQDGVAKLRWFDSAAGGLVITDIGASVENPRIVMDDKRPLQVQVSDIILGYVRGGSLHYRQQRDRFLIERLLSDGPHKGLIKIGMGRNLRLQFVVEV